VPGNRDRTESLLLPPEPGALWIGLAIAVLGPIAITPLVRTEWFDTFAALPYMLAVVAATLFGRLVAAGVATLASVLLLDLFVVRPRGDFGVRSADLVALLVFAGIALVVSQLVVRLERARRAETAERERLSFVSRAADAMSGPLDADDALKHLAGVLVPELADWFSVDLVDEGVISNALVVHPDPAKVGLARELQARFPTDPDAPSGAPAVIRTGRSELTEEITDEMIGALVEDPHLRAAISALRLRSAMVVPLTARGRTFGALTLVRAETHGRYDRDDLRLAEEIADRAALALDTAYLFAAESEARATATDEARRNAILKDVTAAFGLARTVDEVMVAMLEEGIRTAGASAGTVGLVVDGERVELVGTSGYEPDDHPYWHAFELRERLPMSDAILQRQPVVVETTAERDRRYPALRGRGEQRDHVLVCLPLMLGRESIGGFSASYPPGTRFGPSDLSFLLALGEQCGQAIDRARSIERERETRGRFDALATSSRALARTLDYDGTATTIVRLATEYLGGEATLYVRDRDEYSVLAAHRRGAEPATVDGPPAPAADPEIVAEILQAAEEASPRLLPPAPDGDGRPGLVLPLGIAQFVLGALVVTDPVRDFGRRDELDFAREVARRMARALENARLYRERDYAARTLQQSLLPPALPEIPGVEVATMFLPAIRGYEVGGDFYDVFQVADGRWVAVIGDVCGKGVEAATLTGLARHTLRALSDVERPSGSLRALNGALLRERLDGRFCTVAQVMLDPKPDGVRLRVSCGGHPLPHHVSTDGATHLVGTPGTLLGVVAEPRLEDVATVLGPGEALVMVTDGIFRKHEAFGDEPGGLDKVLSAGPPGSAEELIDRIRRYVEDLIADEQDDDIAVLVLYARPS
jgi:serine phosphatase RsbU (regulator of sigma subunit)